MIQAIENLPIRDNVDNQLIKLQVELVGELFKRNYNQKGICEYTGQSKGNVSRFCTKHKGELDYIRDINDNLVGNGFKRIVYHGTQLQITRLTQPNEAKKISTYQAAGITGLANQNQRLCAEKATEIHSVDYDTSLADLNKREQELRAKLESSTGVIEEIIDV